MQITEDGTIQLKTNPGEPYVFSCGGDFGGGEVEVLYNDGENSIPIGTGINFNSGGSATFVAPARLVDIVVSGTTAPDLIAALLPVTPDLLTALGLAGSQKSFLRLGSNSGSGQNFPDGEMTTLLWGAPVTAVGDLFSYNEATGGITVSRDAVVTVEMSVGPDGGDWAGLSIATLLISTNGNVENVAYEYGIDGAGRPYPTTSANSFKVQAGDVVTTSFIAAGAALVSLDFNPLNFLTIREF